MTLRLCPHHGFIAIALLMFCVEWKLTWFLLSLAAAVSGSDDKWTYRHLGTVIRVN